MTQETMTTTPLLLTPEEAARVLSIGRTKLYALLRTGTLPSVTIGASRRVRITDLEDLVDQLPSRRRHQDVPLGHPTVRAVVAPRS